MAYENTKRKVFISFYKGNKGQVDEFIDTWSTKHGVFTPRVLGASDNDKFIDSNNPEYVMTQIRKKYLGDSTVTIVLIGSCTHSRRYVDWEIKSSLRRGEYTPNGLIGINLPSLGKAPEPPPRLSDNLNSGHSNCYARYWVAPTTASQLRQWIEDAYFARTSRANLIKSSQAMMKYNATCHACGVTH